MYYKSFLKKYWWLLLALTVLPLGSMIAFCFNFNLIDDAGAWVSMVSGIFSYIGSIFLAIVVFYHSYCIEKKHAHQEIMNFSIIGCGNWSGSCFAPIASSEIEKEYIEYGFVYEKVTEHDSLDDFSYINIEIKNSNTTYPLSVMIIGVYYLDALGKLHKCKKFAFKSIRKIRKPLSFNEEHKIYIGLPKNILKLDFYKYQKVFDLFVVFELHDNLGHQIYSVENYTLSPTFGMNRFRYTPKEYKRLIKKKGNPIVLTKANKIHIKSNLDFIKQKEGK